MNRWAFSAILCLSCTSQLTPVTDDRPATGDTSDSDSDTHTDTETDTDKETDTETDEETDTDTGPDEEPLCASIPPQTFQPVAEAKSGGAIFRYRTYTGDAPSWVSTVGATNLVLRDGADVTPFARGPEVYGLRPFRHTNMTTFSGTQYWLAANAIDAESLTIQAWFRTDTAPDWHTIFSNTEGGGFSLKLHQGRLRGLFRVENGDKWADLEHYGSWAVDDGRWHHAAFTVQRSASGYRLCMWLDGDAECVLESSTADPKRSNIVPAVGAEPDEADGTYTVKSFYSGDIYAVVVSDYVVQDNWLADRVLRDGSQYFDTPSYHDYLSGKDGVDQRVADAESPHQPLLDATVARYRLPFQDDRYIVQGVGAHDSGEVWLSLYYGAKDKDTTCSQEPYVVHSLLVGFDPCTSKMTRVLMLEGPTGITNMDHVGGMAVVGDQAWTMHSSASGRVLARYDLLEPGRATEISDPVSSELFPSGPPRFLTAAETVAVDADCGASWMSYDPVQHQLWMGTFSTSSGAPVCAFSLTPDGRINARVRREFLPISKVQGVLARPDGSLLLSRSYGDNHSGLYHWVLGADEANLLITGPAGFEDLAVSRDGKIWTASESGARYFQKRFSENALCGPGWGDLYPYAFALDPETLNLP